MREIFQLSRKAMWVAGATGLVMAGAGTIRAQETLGGLGAAGSMSAGMNANSNAGMGKALQNARGAGVSSAGAAGGDEGGTGSGGGGSGGGGYPGAGGAGGAAAPPRLTPGEPTRFSTDTGAEMLNQLLAAPGPRITSPSPTRHRRSSRAQARYANRVRHMTPQQRTRMVMQKYKIPAVSWLSYYVPEDRYKLTSGQWKYVSFEDDPKAYPMRYYYRPTASNFLSMIGHSPRGVHRYNRILGFYTWQDAVLAGYRPDPVSRPEPGSQLAAIARLTRGPHLASYVEYIYSGQVTPETFAANYNYIQQVATTLNAHPQSRPLVGQTVEQVLGALLGEGSVPRSVGGPPPMPAAGGGAGGYPGGSGGYPGSSGGGYPGGSGGGYPGGSGGYPGGGNRPTQ